MKKRFSVSFSVFVMLFLTSSLVFAATGPATVYKVTITKFELFNGTSFITVFTGSSTIDIASADIGAAAGNFFAGLSVPDGSYTQMKVTISDTFTISGNVGANYTTAATGGAPTGCLTGTAAQQAECTISLPTELDPPTADVLETTLTVTNGIPSHKIRVSFDVSAGIDDNSTAQLYPGFTTPTIKMIAL